MKTKHQFAPTTTRRNGLWSRFRGQIGLQLMVLPIVVWMLVFCYYPMLGLQIAFKDYKFNLGIWGSQWVGLQQFRDFFSDPYIVHTVLNTIAISVMKVFLMFPIPIVFALILNEMGQRQLKRVTQTITYFPYFVSWPILALMLTRWLSPSNGLVNNILVGIGILKEPYLFLGDPKAFWWLSLAIVIWKETGWGSIIYLAAINSIDQEMYEAATVEGASRLQKIRYITVPSIAGTIMILFILNVGALPSGGLYGSNFTISYLLGNPLNINRAEILDTYVFKIGISLGRFSYAAAVSVILSVVSFLLLFGANRLSKRTTNESIM